MREGRWFESSPRAGVAPGPRDDYLKHALIAARSAAVRQLSACRFCSDDSRS